MAAHRLATGPPSDQQAHGHRPEGRGALRQQMSEAGFSCSADRRTLPAMTGLRSLRTPLALFALVLLVALVALPVLAASPNPSGGAAAASEKPGKGPKDRAAKEPSVEVTLQGEIRATTDEDGATTYEMTANGKSVRLDAGPAWFHGDKHPLAAFVGKTVTVVGGQRGDEVDVESVDGVALRAGGKPPWAGGWKAVGQAHPGWSQEKWDRWKAHVDAKGEPGARGNGAKVGADGCWPPGKCKADKPTGSDDPSGG